MRIVAARTRNPNIGLGILSSRPLKDALGRQIEPSEVRLLDRRPVLRRPSANWRSRTLERDGSRERHDDEADAADPQSGDCDEEPDDGGGGGPDQERDRKFRPDASEVRCQVRHGEARDSGERQLHDGDLADEADDHDEREADDDAEQ